MEDILQHNNQIYIRASARLADQRLRVLKHGEAFGIFDVFGDIKPVGIGAQGLYSGATRFLSRLELRFGNRYPTLLSSTVTNDDMLMTADLSNPDIEDADCVSPHSSFHVFRSKFLLADSCYEQLQITNFSDVKCSLPLTFFFQSDFVDMFEIRGIPREKRGTILPAEVGKNQVVFRYIGLDEQIRSLRLTFFSDPLELTDSFCRFSVNLPPGHSTKLYLTMDCLEGEKWKEAPKSYPEAFDTAERYFRRNAAAGCLVQSSSERFRTWMDRSKADIFLMVTQRKLGTYPYAGIPWFNTVFGRDGIITAMQYLWVDPRLAREVLSYLAILQAREDVPFEDAEPGKIVHELRRGEMVSTGEVPFRRYYGAVDSTPLFIMLAGRYLETTADLTFIENLWPVIRAGLRWIDEHGDLDGDGFIEYFRRSPRGLINQGWKDSGDSVSHADGRLAEGPIALVEVQSYVYDAKIQASKIAKRLGLSSYSERLLKEAEELRRQFDQFWVPRLDCLALALDGAKNPCAVVSSNAGQALFSGILDPVRAEKVGRRMLSEEMFSGWGVRTLSAKEARYNPMSYHNGSIWPHDNSLIAEGLARYGMKEEVLLITEALFDVSVNVDLFRLPELFCGFPRREGQGPTLYPVACSPQAWAAGSVFQLLKACLGLHVDGFNRVVSFLHPVLPRAIEELLLRNLRVGEGEVDLLFRRHGSEVNLFVERRVGKVEVNILK